MNSYFMATMKHIAGIILALGGLGQIITYYVAAYLTASRSLLLASVMVGVGLITYSIFKKLLRNSSHVLDISHELPISYMWKTL